MSTEAVEILIKADDQASAKFAAVSTNVKQAGTQINTAFKDTSRTTKSVAELAGVLANLTGNSELASFASQMAGATEKVSQFSDVAKKGGAGATAFKLGLIGLAAGAGFALGRMLADWIRQTEKFERALALAKEQAASLEQQLKGLAQTRFSETKEDIELIRDPDQKRAAYEKLFTDLQRQIVMAGAAEKNSQKQLAEESSKWFGLKGKVGNQLVKDAEEQAKAARANVDALKAQASEIGKLIGQRAQNNALLAAENAAKDKSEAYIETLRQEVEYLNATREEQIKLDAARNTTAADRGEAERLLQERDAILAKAEAAKELEATQKRAQDEAARAAKQAADEAANERKRMMDMEKSIQERIDLRYIELTQGKEAARVQELINQGLDAATAKRFAAQEAQLEQMGQKGGGGPLAALNAMESRLLTRGPGKRQEDHLENISRKMGLVVDSTDATYRVTYQSQQTLNDIRTNTSKTTQLVPTP